MFALLTRFFGFILKIFNFTCPVSTRRRRFIIILVKKIPKKILGHSGFQIRSKLHIGTTDYSKWINENEPDEKCLKKQRLHIFKYQPTISIITPVYNTPKKYLIKMIESVLSQTYNNWELCIVDGASSVSYLKGILQKYEKKEKRIKVKYLKMNKGISGNSNEAIALSKGEYIALLDHDDMLTPFALYEVVKAINQYNPDLIYTDEDKIDKYGNRLYPFFKPDWSPDLLRSQNYICHLSVIKKSLITKTKGFRSKYNGAQDYDLFLRISELTNKIQHIPKILYHWRMSKTSTASNPESKPYSQISGLKSINDHLQRVYKNKKIKAVADRDNLFVYNVRYGLEKKKPKVTIIIPTKDKIDLLSQCVMSIFKKSSYKNYEIIIINNNSELSETFTWFKHMQKQFNKLKIIRADFSFNWAKLNNLAIQHAKGDVFIFLNNDTKVITKDWIERLVEQSLRKGVGAVGPLLLYKDETIQHAGVVLGMGGWADHIYKGVRPVHFSSPFISPMVRRNVMAVTGACLSISRNTINRIGDFNEKFIITGSDIEICLRAHKNGLVNIYDPNIRLYHYESKSRIPTDIPSNDFKLSAKYYKPYRIDKVEPYYNPNLSLFSSIPILKD